MTAQETTENPAPTRTAEVVIVGAGPTGLLLAGDLAAAGVDTVVLERRAGGEANTTRAFAVHARTLEELDARGLADELVATGLTVGQLRLYGDLSIDLSGLPSRFPFLLVTPQYETERLLARRARAAGARFVDGATVTGVRQDAGGVEVTATGAEGTAGVSTWRAAYAVGTDGIRSAVRHAIGVPYPGESVLRSIMLADVRLTDAPADVLGANAGRDGFAFLAPFGDGYYRIMAWDRTDERPDGDPVDLESFRRVVRDAFGTDYGLHDARWTSRFHSDERQAPHYRVGRVFLAGDAAHCHSPAGGQGMNTGLQDAANLSWKLVAVLRHDRPDTLLDSYEAERHPVGAAVLRSSGTLVRAATAHSWVARTARNLLGGALASLASPVASRMAGDVSGVDVDYPAPHGSHRATGDRAADVELTGTPARLYEALRERRFVLLAAGDVDLGRDDVVVARPVAPERPYTLVRPDGYVAWASDTDDPAALEGALHTWCGSR